MHLVLWFLKKMTCEARPTLLPTDGWEGGAYPGWVWGESEGGALVTGYLHDVQCVHTIGLSICFQVCVCQFWAGWWVWVNNFLIVFVFQDWQTKTKLQERQRQRQRAREKRRGRETETETETEAESERKTEGKRGRDREWDKDGGGERQRQRHRARERRRGRETESAREARGVGEGVSFTRAHVCCMHAPLDQPSCRSSRQEKQKMFRPSSCSPSYLKQNLRIMASSVVEFLGK